MLCMCVTDSMGATCDICGKLYKTVADLKVHHKRIHLNIYPYHCSKCGHGVQRKEWLATHKCENVRPRQTRDKPAGKGNKKQASRSRGKTQSREDLLQRLMVDVDLYQREENSTAAGSSQEESRPDGEASGLSAHPPDHTPVTSSSSAGYLDSAPFSLQRARGLLQSPMVIQPSSHHNFHAISFSPHQPHMPLLPYTEPPYPPSESDHTDVPWADSTWPNTTT